MIATAATVAALDQAVVPWEGAVGSTSINSQNTNTQNVIAIAID